jgi:thiamine biosynthesis lipoprotein
MTADAYATAFMVVGLERAQQLLAAHPELKAYFIYETENGELRMTN